MRDVEATADQWDHFAKIVRSRRESLGLTQKEVAERSHGMLSAQVLQLVEGAKRARYRRRSLLGLMRVLGWSDESLERTLAGENPEARSAGQASKAVEDALAEIRSGVGHLERALADRANDPAGR